MMTPDELRARVLYRDPLVLIIDKPAGLPVHAGPKGGPNLEQALDALRCGRPRPPGLAHRLDRDTSGCLVLGRDRRALARLGRLFAAGRVEKVYWAIVTGTPPASEGRIDLPLAKRSTAKRGWWMTADPDQGRPAVTDYRTLGRAGGHTWLELCPRTGRTHQIRVHCATALGCPVLGETIYAPRAEAVSPEGGAPLHLHARAVGLPLYPDRPAVTAAAPPPPHMLAALRACGFGSREAAESADAAAAR